MLAKGGWRGHRRCSAALRSLAASLLFLRCAAAGGGAGDALGDACPANFPSFARDAGLSALCTTITLTSTTTTTTTSRGNTTTTSTSSPQPRDCRVFCAGNGHQWFIKCGWAVCALCRECNTLVIPNPPAPVPPPGSGGSPSTSPSPPTPAPAPAGPGPTPAPAPAPTPPPPPTVSVRRRRSTTTTQTTRAPWCIASCRRSNLPWSMLCTWAMCEDCAECFPFTTTETSTGTTTTTTDTITTTTDTLTTTTVTSTTTRTTTTRTTYPGETTTRTSTITKTSTRTTSTTTTTQTLTSTTVTTTGMECSPPSPYLPTHGCQHNITAGSICSARTFRTACVDQSDLYFLCDFNNTVHDEPTVVSGTYDIHCQICGMLSSVLMDGDPRPGIISTVIYFGPNAINGIVNETEILGYAAFMVDDCGRTVGNPVAYAPRRRPNRELCCQHDAYTLKLFARLGVNETGTAFTILPNTTGGLLPIGATTNVVVDDASNTVAVVATWSGARQRSGGGAARLAAVCLGAWLASVA